MSHTHGIGRVVLSACIVLAAGASAAVRADVGGQPADAAHDSLSSGLAVYVSAFRFEGNTVFTDEQLAEVVAGFIDRELTTEQLEAARQAVTLHYINGGYINSGATLPDQSVVDGVVWFTITEGQLSQVTVQGNERLKSDYIRKRVERGASVPLSLHELRDALELVRQNPNIGRVNAELRPGAAPGDSLLDVTVEEAKQFRAGFRFSNSRPPSLGAERLELLLAHSNLTGNGDALNLQWGITKGGIDEMNFGDDDEINVSYTIPLNEDDVTLQLSFTRSDTLVIEDPFSALNINSESESFGFTVRVPVERTPNSEFALSFGFENRSNETFIGSTPFSFSPGAENGQTEVTALRFTQEWVNRSQTHAVAARSTMSVGVDALGATANGNSVPDGQFFSWLGQVQYIQLIPDTNNQLVVRISGQVAADPLLTMEQFSIGGSETVRGYRENQLVRDEGVVVTVEFRVPLVFDAAGNAVFTLVPFYDFGSGSNITAGSVSNDISSAGLGLVFQPNDQFSAQLFWGQPFRKIDTPEFDLQDIGLHFNIVFWAF